MTPAPQQFSGFTDKSACQKPKEPNSKSSDKHKFPQAFQRHQLFHVLIHFFSVFLLFFLFLKKIK